MTSAIYHDPRWRPVRAYVLERDGYVCQLRGPRCRTRATEVDHVIEVAAGGPPFDPDNLRAACKPCNSSRGATFGNRGREPRSRSWYVA